MIAAWIKVIKSIWCHILTTVYCKIATSVLTALALLVPDAPAASIVYRPYTNEKFYQSFSHLLTQSWLYRDTGMYGYYSPLITCSSNVFTNPETTNFFMKFSLFCFTSRKKFLIEIKIDQKKKIYTLFQQQKRHFAAP